MAPEPNPTGNDFGAAPRAFSVECLVDGFPGKTATHGGFGWSSVYLLRGAGRVILVETGPAAYIPLLSARLGKLNLSPYDVTDILITHSHWDHISNIMMFPEASVWIGSEELLWAKSLGADAPFSSPLHINELHRRGDAVVRVSEGDECLPGLSTLATPGHTPGHVAYAARTQVGPVLFAGDAVKNLYELETFEVASTLDPAASHASIRRLRTYMEETGAVLVPGHDVPLILSRNTVVRTRRQRAQISFLGDLDSGEVDRSIADTDE